jgi:hypothetical protein
LPVCAQAPARFANPITSDVSDGAEHWETPYSLCTYEKSFDGKWSIAIDSTATPGAGHYVWATKMLDIKPNTDYRVSFDRMYDTLPSQIGLARCHIFGREIPIPNSDQPRMWDRFTIQMNSGIMQGDVPFDILHYRDDKKNWFRNFTIDVVQAVPAEPINGQIVGNNNPILRWEATSDASFAVQVSDDPEFPEGRTQAYGPILDRDNWQVQQALAPGKWYWRVSVASSSLIDPEGATYSPTQNFTVSENATALPVVKTELPVVPAPGPRKITTDSRGRILVDGEPIFLIGLYGVMERSEGMVDDSYMTAANIAATEPVFEEMAQAGFNTVQNYGTAHGRAEATDAYLDLADRYGMWVLMQLTGVEGMHYDVIHEQLSASSHHPSVLTWLLVDEGDMKGWSPVKARALRDFMRRIDPSRPVGMVVRDCLNYTDAVDLLLPDPYTLRTTPTPQYDLYDMLVDSRTASDSAKEPTSVVSLLQGFKFEDWFDKPNRDKGRVPSYEEERCISYLGIAAGHQGVLFFTYNGSASHMKDNPGHWAAMKQIAGELRDRTPIFLAEEVAIPGSVSGDGLVCFARQTDDGTYLFVINPDAAPHTVQIIFDSETRDVTLLETEQNVPTDSVYEDELAPFVVHTFRIR